MADEVIGSGWFLLGERINTFENDSKNYGSYDRADAVSIGLDALRLFLRAYIELGDIQQGDEVIIP